MKKRLRIVVVFSIIFAMLLGMTHSSVVNAENVCMIKIPVNATLMIKGNIVDESKLVKQDIYDGRIHEIAASQLGVVAGYKQYMVTNLASPDEITVLDANMNQIYPTYADVGVIEYAQSDATFAAQVTERVRNAAIAYHNRTAGAGGNFGSYILKGSDAYNKCIASDAGRKWGKFVNPRGISSVEVSEICQYTNQAFTAKATITSMQAGTYVEKYDIYMLFQLQGSEYYMTNFTFMP